MEKKVELYKEHVNKEGKTERICKAVTASQAELIFKMGGAALFIKEVAKFYEEELEKARCEDCKETLSWLIEEHYRLAKDLTRTMDSFAFMCDLDLKYAAHMRMEE